MSSASSPETRVAPPDHSADEELARLPPPRRPFRRLTLLVMGFTAACSVWLGLRLIGDFVYSLQGGPPRDIGDLAGLAEGPSSNRWVRAEGELSPTHVVRYRRPLESDAHRLARVEGNPKIWVELRVPEDADGERFVAPGSFVGRLVRVSDAGLRYGALGSAVAEAGKPPLGSDSWLLIDGESPATTRWVIALMLLLLGFATFNIVGIIRLARPVRDA